MNQSCSPHLAEVAVCGLVQLIAAKSMVRRGQEALKSAKQEMEVLTQILFNSYINSKMERNRILSYLNEVCNSEG